ALDCGWLTKYSWKCEPVDHSNTPHALRTQFCLAFLHNSQLLFRDCGYPRWSVVLTLPNAIFFYYLFFDFYKKAYVKKEKKNLLQASSTLKYSDSLGKQHTEYRVNGLKNNIGQGSLKSD
ncbi:hypothetical protein NQ314_014513, partial [Rhamnusium bicolor]